VLTRTADNSALANSLLAALPAADRDSLLAQSRRVQITRALLRDADNTIDQVFFPIDSFVALVGGISGDGQLEVGMVGSEGMLGIPAMLGVQAAPIEWLVQGAGRAWQISAEALRAELAASAPLHDLLNRYLCVMLAQLGQTAACKRFHVIEARLARWLLMTRDRAHDNHFHATHEALACLMGVRRAGITRAASSLQEHQLISYSRGDVRILDGPGLETAACACYAADNQIYSRILGQDG
jgi:CRP-like cAMP-binding protein